jgi:hypothetical protein
MKRVSEDSMLRPSTSNGYDGENPLLCHREHRYECAHVDVAVAAMMPEQLSAVVGVSHCDNIV